MEETPENNIIKKENVILSYVISEVYCDLFGFASSERVPLIPRTDEVASQSGSLYSAAHRRRADPQGTSHDSLVARTSPMQAFVLHRVLCPRFRLLPTTSRRSAPTSTTAAIVLRWNRKDPSSLLLVRRAAVCPTFHSLVHKEIQEIRD